jgi:2-phosphoglycolate phosphatase
VANSPGAFRAVLFDFDGTLADSYTAITASVNHVRALHHLPPLPENDVRCHVGYGPGHLLEATVGVGSPVENAAAYRSHHPSVLREGTRLLAGAENVLRLLRESGIRTGICSNKPVAFTRELSRCLGIADLLEIVLGPEDVARPKPAPDMLLEAMHRLKLPAADILYVGDMVVDVQTARGAGIAVWIVPTGSDERPKLAAANPDRLLNGLDDLAKAFAN